MSHLTATTVRTTVAAGILAAAVGLSACGVSLKHDSDPASAPVTVTAPGPTVTVTQSSSPSSSPGSGQSESSVGPSSSPPSQDTSPVQPQQSPPASAQQPSTLDISTSQKGIPCDNRDARVHGEYITVSFAGTCRSVTVYGTGYTEVFITKAGTVTSTASNGRISVKVANSVDVSRAGEYYTVNCGSTPQGHLIPVKKNPKVYQSFTRCLTSS